MPRFSRSLSRRPAVTWPTFRHGSRLSLNSELVSRSEGSSAPPRVRGDHLKQSQRQEGAIRGGAYVLPVQRPNLAPPQARRGQEREHRLPLLWRRPHDLGHLIIQRIRRGLRLSRHHLSTALVAPPPREPIASLISSRRSAEVSSGTGRPRT